MSFWSRFFGKSNSDDFEQVLTLLAEDITKRRNELNEIRLRERRSTLLVTLYTFSFWALYLSIWYLGYLPNISGHGNNTSFEKVIRGIPVVIGPIIILFVRRIVQIWYKRKGDHEEKVLKDLMKQQKAKIQEFKDKTNFDKTRILLEQYDESPNNTPRRPPPNGLSSMSPKTFETPKRPLRTPISPRSALPPSGTQALSPQNGPLPPARKKLFDKLADAILGDDDQGPSPAASRYALICEKCFTHNGLVRESMFEHTQYICLKCGHFNASISSKKSNSSLAPSPVPPKITLSTPLPPVRVSPPEPRAERKPSSVYSDDDKKSDEGMDMELDCDA